MAFDQLKLENQVCFPLYAASRLVIQAYQEDLNRLNITYPQYLVMMVLWEKDEQTVNEIAEKLILNTNTVTPLLKRMESLELINRTSSKTDQRKVIINLTEKGKEMQESAATIPYNLMQKLNPDFSPIDIEEAKLLKNKLYELIHLLEKIEKP